MDDMPVPPIVTDDHGDIQIYPNVASAVPLPALLNVLLNFMRP